LLACGVNDGEDVRWPVAVFGVLLRDVALDDLRRQDDGVPPEILHGRLFGVVFFRGSCGIRGRLLFPFAGAQRAILTVRRGR
jgi:hypothetical protein